MSKLSNVIKRSVFDFGVNTIGSSVIILPPIRKLIYQCFGIKTSTQRIRPRNFFNGNNITIGNNTYINYDCYFDTSGGITIGKDCAFGMQVLLCTTTHEVGSTKQRAGKSIPRPITIADGCWIGARAQILPGVKIGEGCIIAAGALINKDCEPNGLYAGVPARRIRDLN